MFFLKKSEPSQLSKSGVLNEKTFFKIGKSIFSYFVLSDIFEEGFEKRGAKWNFGSD
jgi:hypothetical protein